MIKNIKRLVVIGLTIQTIFVPCSTMAVYGSEKDTLNELNKTGVNPFYIKVQEFEQKIKVQLNKIDQQTDQQYKTPILQEVLKILDSSKKE